MSKIHSSNGFEYRCERSLYGVTWYFRPHGAEIFINYQCDQPKTLKKDIEFFLANPRGASAFYGNSIKQQSDIKAAGQNLRAAEAYFEKVNSPDFDLRGNNPNKEFNAQRDAENRLFNAKNRLATAIR